MSSFDIFAPAWEVDRSPSLHVQQWLGAPLYFLNERWYYAWQAGVKQSTALMIIVLNQLRAPTTVRISGDASVTGQIRGGKRLELHFPDRMVLIANHQVLYSANLPAVLTCPDIH